MNTSLRFYSIVSIVCFLLLLSWSPSALAESGNAEVFDQDSKASLLKVEAELQKREAKILAKLGWQEAEAPVAAERELRRRVYFVNEADGILEERYISLELSKEAATELLYEQADRLVSELELDSPVQVANLPGNEGGSDTKLAVAANQKAKEALADYENVLTELNQTSELLSELSSEVEKLAQFEEKEPATKPRVLKAERRQKEDPALVSNITKTVESEPVFERSDLSPKPKKYHRVAEVVTRRANVYTAPQRHHSVILALSAGEKVAVLAKYSDWTKVITPHGTTAWMKSEVLS